MNSDPRSRQRPSPAVTWERYFAELVAYHRTHRHTRAPAGPGRGGALGRWVLQQRVLALTGRLPADHLARLDQLGFDWDPRESAWQVRLAELSSFRRKHKHCLVPSGWPENPTLAKWVRAQRKLQKSGKLRRDRFRELERLGFWDRRGAGRTGRTRARSLAEIARWNERFARLVEYQRVHGHCRVPCKYPEDPSWGHWVHNLRISKRLGTLDPVCLARLESIGFEWKDVRWLAPTSAEHWEMMLTELGHYCREHGHANVPKGYLRPGNVPLGGWVYRQRVARRKGELSAERIGRLDALGFDWGPGWISEQTRWNERFARLVEFQRQHGHCHVPAKGPDYAWRHWVHNLRIYKRNGTLSAERTAQLEAIGFEWKGTRMRAPSMAEHWQQMLSELQGFHQQHGHTEVPVSVPGLGKWVCRQRTAKRLGELSPERQAQLEAIGFGWGVTHRSRDQRWEERFARLVDFQREHGHCHVPAKGPDYAWRHWVHNLRIYKRNGTLKPEWIARLEAIGFEWSGSTLVQPQLQKWWDAKYAQFEQFIQQHGHTRVPKSAGRLVKWIYDQRKARRNGRLSAERIARLDAIGFPWEPTRAPARDDGHPGESSLQQRWEARLAELERYRQERGCCPPRRTSLGQWLSLQRHQMRHGKLSPSRQQLLEAAGVFESTAAGTFQNPRTERRLAELTAFQQREGHCRVGAIFRENRSLAYWLYDQRQRHRKGSLDPELFRRLCLLGMEW